MNVDLTVGLLAFTGALMVAFITAVYTHGGLAALRRRAMLQEQSLLARIENEVVRGELQALVDARVLEYTRLEAARARRALGREQIERTEKIINRAFLWIALTFSVAGALLAYFDAPQGVVSALTGILAAIAVVVFVVLGVVVGRAMRNRRAQLRDELYQEVQNIPEVIVEPSASTIPESPR